MLYLHRNADINRFHRNFRQAEILGQKFSFVFLFTFPRKQIQDPINVESHCNTTCYNANLDVMLLCHDFH